MRKFLIVSTSLLVLALIAVLLVFVWLNIALSDQVKPAGESVEVEEVTEMPKIEESALLDEGEYTNSITGSSTNNLPLVESDQTNSAPSFVPSEGIPLSDIPLSDVQKTTLGAAGVDADTFVITPQMEACARAKIGGERIVEIAAGESPSIFEITKLIPCLGE